MAKPVYRADKPGSSRAYTFFDRLKGDTPWPAIEAQAGYKNNDLGQSYHYLLARLAEAGHKQIIRVDLTKPNFKIPVVKVLIPSLRFKRELF